jgi:hypothetical protein
LSSSTPIVFGFAPNLQHAVAGGGFEPDKCVNGRDAAVFEAFDGQDRAARLVLCHVNAPSGFANDRPTRLHRFSRLRVK